MRSASKPCVVIAIWHSLMIINATKIKLSISIGIKSGDDSQSMNNIVVASLLRLYFMDTSCVETEALNNIFFYQKSDIVSDVFARILFDVFSISSPIKSLCR